MLCYAFDSGTWKDFFMEVIRDLSQIGPGPLYGGGCVLTIGNFDGVHIAHKMIITKVVQKARERGKKSVVITFEPHPQQFLHPGKKPFYLITTLDEKLEIMKGLGVDTVIVINFSAEFSKLTANEFICNIIWGMLKPGKIFIGHDNTFGRGKEGKPAYVKQLGEKLGFDVEIIEAVCLEGLVVSSTAVRNAVGQGDMRLAAILLGRPYSVEGKVVEGDKRGRQIGFPTANIKPLKELLPGRGVYATMLEADAVKYDSVTNIGFNPTFSDREILSMETHVLDTDRDFYGKPVKVFFLERLRGEKKFAKVQDLVEQIGNDIARARGVLKLCSER